MQISQSTMHGSSVQPEMTEGCCDDALINLPILLRRFRLPDKTVGVSLQFAQITRFTARLRLLRPDQVLWGFFETTNNPAEAQLEIGGDSTFL